MDAVLKHLGLRSDFIVCHPDVIDDPLFHTRRPPHTPTPTSSFATLYFPLQFHHATFFAHLQGILNISYIYMDPGVCN